MTSSWPAGNGQSKNAMNGSDSGSTRADSDESEPPAMQLTDDEIDQILLLHSVLTRECEHRRGINAGEALDIANEFFGHPQTPRGRILVTRGVCEILKLKHPFPRDVWTLHHTGDPVEDEVNHECWEYLLLRSGEDPRLLWYADRREYMEYYN
jgi:hypothetical protein